MDELIGPTGVTSVAGVAGVASVEETVITGATGVTGVAGVAGVEETVITGATGVDTMMSLAIVPSATGPTGPVYIATIDQLVTQQSLALAQENADRASLLPLSSPSSYVFTPALQAWASAGFPALGDLVTITLNPPSPCSDGTTRTVYEYVSYLLGKDLGPATVALDAQFLGITVGYILQGNTVRLCVSRE